MEHIFIFSPFCLLSCTWSGLRCYERGWFVLYILCRSVEIWLSESYHSLTIVSCWPSVTGDLCVKYQVAQLPRNNNANLGFKYSVSNCSWWKWHIHSKNEIKVSLTRTIVNWILAPRILTKSKSKENWKHESNFNFSHFLFPSKSSSQVIEERAVGIFSGQVQWWNCSIILLWSGYIGSKPN